MNMKNNKNCNRINNQIDNKIVKIINIDNGPKDFLLKEALQLAKNKNIDLVELSINDNISICKLIDYNKFIYDKNKKQKQNKKNQISTKIKEIQLTPNIADHDFKIKLSYAKRFLEKHHQVKVVLTFKGREQNYFEKGKLIIYEFINMLTPIGKVEQLPKSNDNKIVALISPNR